MKRREFVRATGLGVGAGVLGVGFSGCGSEESGRSAGAAPGADLTTGSRSAGSPPVDFRFAHITDPHIQPELGAARGCHVCFEQVTRQEPDFSIVSGDLVFDVMHVDMPRARDLFDLWDEARKSLEMPLYQAVGNHDVYGIANDSGAVPDDPLYGKRIYEDRIGPRYYHFDHQGWRFIVLDSIAVDDKAEERPYHGEIDRDQLSWLGDTLADGGTDTPVVMVTHIPIHTGFWSVVRGPQEAAPSSVVVANAKEVMDLIQPYDVKAVLQGHTHIRETIDYDGCKYITSGAVCGDWWKGSRMGHPEGYAMIEARDGEIHWRYHTYGWTPVEP